MLLIEKVVKLLDDFHFDVFRDFVKGHSIRSLYPLALIDVIDRSLEEEQDSEELYKSVYGERPAGEKEMKKFFQLASYTFRMTSILARNYPNYLNHNLSLTQRAINGGAVEKAIKRAEVLREVAEKIEDFDTELGALNILAQNSAYTGRAKEAINYQSRITEILQYITDLHTVNSYASNLLLNKGKENKDISQEEQLSFFVKYANSKSLVVQLMSRQQSAYIHYFARDGSFYTDENYKELLEIEDMLTRYGYIVFPFMHNLRPKVSFLKINYSMSQLEPEKLFEEAVQIMEDSEDDWFWNSYINQAEINSIAIQTSYYLSNFYWSYRDNHEALIDELTQKRIEHLKKRCRHYLDNKTLEENFVVRYINLSALFAGLLILGNTANQKEGIQTLENLLIFYQQVPFHASIDSIYTCLLMGSFALKDFELCEKSYRRYKKSTKEKVVHQDNDLVINGFFYLSKWMETGRTGYVKKLDDLLNEAAPHTSLKATLNQLIEAAIYIKMPIMFENS